MKKQQLERILQGLAPVPQPKASLEQYSTPAGLAADILYVAHVAGDVAGRSVVDLGCGNGIFALGALLLGAADVAGFEVDASAVEVAVRNASLLRLQADFRVADVTSVEGHWDTCLMNPPFGSQSSHADLPFLDTALGVADVTYSLHNAATTAFIRDYLSRKGGRVALEQRYKFPIPHLFSFHRRETEESEVTLFRFEARDNGREQQGRTAGGGGGHQRGVHPRRRDLRSGRQDLRRRGGRA